LTTIAKAFGIPTVLTTVNAERGGVIFKQIQAVFPDQKRVTTSLSLHYHVRPGLKDKALVEMKEILDRCANETEFIMAIIHEAPERPNEFIFYELWKGTRAEFDAIQGPKPYRKSYMENVKQYVDKVRG
jgi:quinol monooxygenase YgiN